MAEIGDCIAETDLLPCTYQDRAAPLAGRPILKLLHPVGDTLSGLFCLQPAFILHHKGFFTACGKHSKASLSFSFATGMYETPSGLAIVSP